MHLAIVAIIQDLNFKHGTKNNSSNRALQPREFGTVQMGPKCRKDFGPKYRTVQPHGPNCPAICTNESHPTDEVSHVSSWYT